MTRKQPLRDELLGPRLSAHAPAFTEAVAEALDDDQEVVVYTRGANCGGGRQEQFLVRRVVEFRDIVDSAWPKTAISVFFATALPIRGVAGAELRTRVLELLQQLLREDEDGVFVIRRDAPGVALGREDIRLLRSPDQVVRWFDDHPGIPILAGELPFWEDNSDRVITAYVPDADGVVRPGAY